MTVDASKLVGNAPGTGGEVSWVNELKRARIAGPRMLPHGRLPDGYSPQTIAIHAGTYEDPNTGAVGTPIFQTSTFLFSEQTYDGFLEGYIRDIPTYSRYGNPSQWAVQEKIAALEGAESAVVMASGMAAISSTLIGLSNNGGHIVTSYGAYGGTYNLLREEMHQMGRSVTYVDPTSIDEIAGAIREETQILFFEVLSNPLLKAIPLVELGELAKKHRLLLILDNTFLTPLSTKPIEHGAHIVIHSGTKYLNGHSDLTCGVAAGPRKYVDRVWAQMLKFGGTLEPIACYLLERGLKTLPLRMRAHRENADAIAAFLLNHPKVLEVHHPSTPHYPYRWLFDYCKEVSCGVVTFVVEGGDAAGVRLLELLKLPKVATSLGGVESLVSLPFNTSQSSLTETQRKAAGINPGMVRYSVGCEDTNDLIADLQQALERL